MRCSYSREDDKLRLYVGRVPRDEYEALRAAGWVSTPKQDCDFVAPWTPEREDQAAEYLDEGEEIGDEDYSPLERSADRAERFEGYREKRTGEATFHADTFGSGPVAFGHQSRDRAERQAKRHDRSRTRAVSQWSKAEYWQQRTAGVIGHALYKSSAKVRRGRILTIEADLRKCEKYREEAIHRFKLWSAVATKEGADRPGIHERTERSIGFTPESVTPALKLAYMLANDYRSSGDYKHPRRPDAEPRSLYSLLSDPEDPITPGEAAAVWLARNSNPENIESRWIQHYKLRLTYERAMLAEEGGSAADAEMIPGGFIGANQIHAINKSPATGRVVSVKIMARSGWNEDGPLKLKSYNIERMPEGAYRAPTAEELANFHQETKKAKEDRKATAPAKPPLVNPTDEDAQRLQDAWNARTEAAAKKNNRTDFVPSTVLRMTQAEYSARSKGAYGSCNTADITEKLEKQNTYGHSGRNHKLSKTVFQVRRTCGTGWHYNADRVIVLTDKPQKAIPWAAVEAVRATMPTPESVYEEFGNLISAIQKPWTSDRTPEEVEAFDNACYIGWAWSQSQTQNGFTEAGCEACKRFEAEQAEAKTDAEPEPEAEDIEVAAGCLC